MIKGFLGVIAGMIVGVVVAILIVLSLLAVMSEAKAHDQINVNVRDGRTYIQQSDHGREAIKDMVLIFNHDQHIPVVLSVDEPTADKWCRDSNRYLQMLKSHVNEEVAKAPEFKETYQKSYDSIERAWCK